MFYSAQEIQCIRSNAKDQNLEAPDLFWRCPAEDLVTICNGCGSENLPQSLRKILSWIYRNYTAAHCIHDFDYTLSDGSDSTFEAVNLRFYKNLRIIWKEKYGLLRWINPVALWGLKKIRIAFKTVSVYGKSAWLAAYAKKITVEGEQ